MQRCPWCENWSDLYIKYHDTEWWIPVHDEMKHFEFLVLETFQAGLSWFTILKKRENFRSAFDNFDYKKIAKYEESKIQELLQNEWIIRNKLKINATINNALKFLEIQKEFWSFDKYIRSFIDNKPIINKWKELKEIPAHTELSNKISKDLKKRWFKFVWTTVIYAHLQAIWVVNDHLVSCLRYNSCI